MQFSRPHSSKKISLWYHTLISPWIDTHLGPSINLRSFPPAIPFSSFLRTVSTIPDSHINIAGSPPYLLSMPSHFPTSPQPKHLANTNPSPSFQLSPPYKPPPLVASYPVCYCLLFCRPFPSHRSPFKGSPNLSSKIRNSTLRGSAVCNHRLAYLAASGRNRSLEHHRKVVGT